MPSGKLTNRHGKSPSFLVNTIKMVDFPASYVSLQEGKIFQSALLLLQTFSAGTWSIRLAEVRVDHNCNSAKTWSLFSDGVFEVLLYPYNRGVIKMPNSRGLPKKIGINQRYFRNSSGF